MRTPNFPYLTSTGGPGFLNAPPERPFARFVVAGIAWDGATTNRPGARAGPHAIRRASQMMCDACHPRWDVSPQPWIADIGDLPLPNTSLAGMREVLVGLAAPLVAAHHMVWLGGDHSITLALLRAYRAHYGRPMAVLHFDARSDTWAEHFGEPSGHGTWPYEAVRDGLVDPAQVRQRLSGGVPLYFSLDIYALDPSHAPGAGTPEPAGLTARKSRHCWKNCRTCRSSACI